MNRPHGRAPALRRAGLVALIVLSTALLPALAQTTSSALIGTLRTTDDGVVAGAVIQVRSNASGVVRTTVTDAQGRYRVDSLTPGLWTVAARLADGQMSQSEVVELHLQETVRLDFTVESGMQERVVVRAEAALVDRRETGGKLSISGERANELPLSGRVFTDLALLDSSVGSAAPGNYFGERGSVFVVNGQSGRSNSFLVDGLDNNDHASGTTSNTNFSQLAIREFVLLTHQYSPEFGRASGGSLNIVTQRGGNEVHWQAFGEGTSATWNSAGDFVDRLPDVGTAQRAVRRNATGFSVGGPFRRDRAFYFAAYERQRSDELIPYTGVDRYGNLGGRFSAPAQDDFFFARTDFNLGNSQSLMLRLTYDARDTAGVNVGGVYTPEAGFALREQDFDFAGGLTSLLGSGLVNEFRFLAARSTFDQFANSDRPGVTRPSGIFGGNNLNEQNRNEDRFQLVENLTYQRRRHTYKLGLDVTRSRTDVRTAFNPNGNFGYNSDFAFEPGDCGNLGLFAVIGAQADGQWPFVPCPGSVGVDDDGDGRIDEPGNVLSYPEVYQFINGEPSAVLADTQIALFFQDRWDVSARLLLDYGLRYDLSTFQLPASTRVDSVVPNGGAGRDYDNLAPRLGFTFTPKVDGKLIVRGGGGVFYDKLVLGFPAVASITSGTEIGLFFPQGLVAEVTEDTVESVGVEKLLPELFFPDNLVMRFTTATELDTPYTTQFNLGVERTLGQHHALRANLIRAQGYHLPLMRDLNPVIGVVFPNSGECPDHVRPYGTVGALPCHREDQNVGSIAALTTEGRSWYTGLDINWRWQRSEDWINASYTLSKAEDTGFDPLKGGISLSANPDDPLAERGRSDGDRRHRLVISGQVGLPWMGLRASGVVRLSSGLPFNITTGRDDNLDGIFVDRPKGVGRNSGADTELETVNLVRTELNRYLPPDQQLAPVSSLREPYFAQLDLRLSRPFGFGSGKQGGGEVFLQVINVLDRENPGLIEGRATSRRFGEAITLAGPPRIVEIGLRVGY